MITKPYVAKSRRCYRCSAAATRVTVLQSHPSVTSAGATTRWVERHCDDHAPIPSLNVRIVSVRAIPS